MTPPFAPRACCASSPLRPPVAPAASSVVRREFPVRGARLLGLTIEPRAAVTITGWDQDRVVVQVGPDGDTQPAGAIEFLCGATERGPVWVHAYDAPPGRAGALRIDVRVPRRFSVALNAPRATVLVAGVDGRVTRNEPRALSRGA